MSMDNNEAWRNQQTAKAWYMQNHHSEVDDLKQQLAAERAKVALAVEALQKLKPYCRPHQWEGRWNSEKQYTSLVSVESPERQVIDGALAALQSTDALADLRREVARECAEYVSAHAKTLPSMGGYAYLA